MVFWKFHSLDWSPEWFIIITFRHSKREIVKSPLGNHSVNNCTVRLHGGRHSSTYFPSVTQIFICTHSSFNMWAISLCESCHGFIYTRQWSTHNALTPLQLNSEMHISVFSLLYFLYVLMYSEMSPIISFFSFICFPHIRINDENYTGIILFQGASYPRRAS